MEKLITLLFILLLLTGCATTYKYVPYTQDKFQPKKQDYPIEFFKGKPKPYRDYKIIGRMEVQGDINNGATWKAIYERLLKIAREKGANAIVNYKSGYKEYSGKLYMPGHTSYEKQTTYHRGSLSTTTRYNYGGYAYSDGSYSGTSTTNVPIYHPGYDIPYSGAILYCDADLAVFTDKTIFDKFIDAGINKTQIHLYPKGIPNLKEVILGKDFTISEVRPGSPFDRVGIRAGDIIKRFNDKDFSSFKELYDYLDSIASNEEVKVEIIRKNVEKTFMVKPSKERPRYGFTFKWTKDKYYQESEDKNLPPLAYFVIDDVGFGLAFSLQKEGILVCSLVIDNESNEEIKISQENIRVLSNNIPLDKLTPEEIANIIDRKDDVEEINELEKRQLKSSTILLGESLIKTLWFRNDLLNPNIEAKVVLDNKKVENIFFGVEN